MKRAVIYSLLIAGLIWVHAPTAVWAQAKQQKLDALSDEIKDRKARQAELKAAAETLKTQQSNLRKRIIALAKDLQNIDAERDRLETRLSELAVTENQLDEDLQRDRAALSKLLAGLQAMQQQPAPAFAVHAEDALDAVQGALVMSAIVPGMQARAGKLRDQLTELSAIRRRMDKQSHALIVAEQDAATARQDMNLAIAQKARAESQARLAAAREAEAIAKLVREARDLRDLTQRLQNRQKSAPPTPSSGPFARARGLLPLPVTGEISRGFGQKNENGVAQQGVSISARAGAQITAPYDAQVLYSGPFRQYGGIVILGVAGGYQMILAGLEDVEGFVGQEILAGEPIGTLLDENQQFGSGSSGRSQLYMELRYKGKPIDPVPWLKS